VFLKSLQREAVMALYPESGIEGTLMLDEVETEIGEESQAFESRPNRRRSLMGAQAPVLAGLESAPLHGMEEDEENEQALIQFE
jgi:hypothetical protein